MPRITKKSKRDWYTYAFFTREGAPHPAHRTRNFTRWHGQLSTLLSDLAHTMKTEIGHRGAYAAAVWPGQLDEWTAMKSDIKPLYYVHEGGRLEKL
jgi:predicted GH43/DUF377 family glycosyl hydrolase